MLQRTGEAETITTHYLAALGVYRALYIPNWVYRFVLFSFVLSPPPCLLPPVSLLELFVVGLGGGRVTGLFLQSLGGSGFCGGCVGICPSVKTG